MTTAALLPTDSEVLRVPKLSSNGLADLRQVSGAAAAVARAVAENVRWTVRRPVQRFVGYHMVVHLGDDLRIPLDLVLPE